ncbi:MAG: hypothetical protein JHC84_00300 [Solirubrobacteraceae bacterium]|nr:hypothetical protein [Solirubrobacteraceae bacterium]
MSSRTTDHRTPAHLGAPAGRLAARWADRAGAVDPDALVLHDALLAAALDVPAGPAVRRPSMCHDGTPVTYSAALDAAGPASPLRLLVEPGGCAVAVPEQLEGTLGLLRGLLRERGWDAARAHLDRVCDAVLPAQRERTGSWWGGAWLGLVAEPGAPTQLRCYLNLRWGSPQARWQRALDAICGAADATLTPTLDGLLRTCAPIGVPVGLGLAFAAGDLRALRLYVGVHEPARCGLAALLPPELSHQQEVARRFGVLATQRLGPPPAQGVTAGYDLVLRDGVVQPGVARCKVDLSCQPLDGPGRVQAELVAREFAAALGLDGGELDRFEADLEDAYGGSTLEFVSLGIRPDRTGMSAYVKPHGLASADR